MLNLGAFRTSGNNVLFRTYSKMLLIGCVMFLRRNVDPVAFLAEHKLAPLYRCFPGVHLFSRTNVS
jgi:hypothetical protein